MGTLGCFGNRWLRSVHRNGTVSLLLVPVFRHSIITITHWVDEAAKNAETAAPFWLKLKEVGRFISWVWSDPTRIWPESKRVTRVWISESNPIWSNQFPWTSRWGFCFVGFRFGGEGPLGSRMETKPHFV